MPSLSETIATVVPTKLPPKFGVMEFLGMKQWQSPQKAFETEAKAKGKAKGKQAVKGNKGKGKGVHANGKGRRGKA